MFDKDFIKEFQIMKDPLEVDNPIPCKIYRYKIWTVHVLW